MIHASLMMGPQKRENKVAFVELIADIRRRRRVALPNYSATRRHWLQVRRNGCSGIMETLWRERSREGDGDETSERVSDCRMEEPINAQLCSRCISARSIRTRRYRVRFIRGNYLPQSGWFRVQP